MGHGHNHNHTADSTKNIRAAFFLNAGFTLFEIVGGFYTNSVAILSDAIHDLGDSLSLGISWYMDKKSKQKRDDKFTFGYKRFSLLGALVNGMVLLFGSVFILSEAIPRLIEPEHANAEGMFVFAIVGVLVNFAAFYRLREGKTMNEKVVRWHLLEDVLGWVAVLIVSIVLMYKDIPILDPLLSIAILSYVMYNVIKNLRETFKIFLQGIPADIDVHEVQSRIDSLDKVLACHHIHVWSLDGEKHVLTLHIVIPKSSTNTDIILVKQQVRKTLEDMHIGHATIEVEFENENLVEDDD